jgi:hypothetical protein
MIAILHNFSVLDRIDDKGLETGDRSVAGRETGHQPGLGASGLFRLAGWRVGRMGTNQRLVVSGYPKFFKC